MHKGKHAEEMITKKVTLEQKQPEVNTYSSGQTQLQTTEQRSNQKDGTVITDISLWSF